MECPSPDPSTLTARVEKLERQNRLFKRAALGLLLLPVCMLVMGQAQPSRTIEADEFVLKDSAGHMRAELTSIGGGLPALLFFDAQGKQESALFEDSYDISGPDPHTSAIYVGSNPSDASDKEPRIMLEGTNGFSAILGSSDLITTRTGEKHQTSAASLVLLGKNGTVLWSAP